MVAKMLKDMLLFISMCVYLTRVSLELSDVVLPFPAVDL
jgi:hypothetical protein